MRPQDDARRSPCSCSDQPPWLQAQGGGDHLPFFFGLRGACARSLAATSFAFFGVFGSRSSLPASLAGFGPVPLPSLLVAIFTPPFGLIYGEDRDVIAVSTPQGSHCPCRDGRPLLQAWVPVALTAYIRQHGLPWLARRITGPATSLVASDAIPLTFNCSRWWSRSLRRRSSCRPGASWFRR